VRRVLFPSQKEEALPEEEGAEGEDVS